MASENLAILIAAVALASLCLASTARSASGDSHALTHAEVQKLVRDMAWNQIHAMRRPPHHYLYILQQSQSGSSKEMVQIETTRGVVSRIIKNGGKPLGKNQCRKNLAQLSNLANNPRQQRSQYNSQKAELARREILFRAMPRALLYTYDGTLKNGLVRLKYRPNPNFSPRGRVENVLQALEGTLLVDPKAQRLAEIDGQLEHAVTIGWGIVARLNPGGTFIMEQHELPDGDWRPTKLNVRFHGSIFFVKSLNVNLKEAFSDYKEVARNISVPKAVQILRKMPCGKPWMEPSQEPHAE